MTLELSVANETSLSGIELTMSFNFQDKSLNVRVSLHLLTKWLKMQIWLALFKDHRVNGLMEQ